MTFELQACVMFTANFLSYIRKILWNNQLGKIESLLATHDMCHKKMCASAFTRISLSLVKLLVVYKSEWPLSEDH